MRETFSLKGVFAKNENWYRLTPMVIATNLTSICCVYKEKMVKHEERGIHTNSKVAIFQSDQKFIYYNLLLSNLMRCIHIS